MNAVEGVGESEALVVVVDDGWIGFRAGVKAVVAQGDGLITKVAGGFVANVLEGEGIVDADLPGGLVVEEFLVELVLLEVTEAVVVEAEAVDGFHAESGVFSLVVGVFDPAGEVFVELRQGGDVFEAVVEELVADSAEEAFDFALWRLRHGRGCG